MDIVFVYENGKFCKHNAMDIMSTKISLIFFFDLSNLNFFFQIIKKV
jgi:hypothetical protein